MQDPWRRRGGASAFWDYLPVRPEHASSAPKTVVFSGDELWPGNRFLRLSLTTGKKLIYNPDFDTC